MAAPIEHDQQMSDVGEWMLLLVDWCHHALLVIAVSLFMSTVGKDSYSIQGLAKTQQQSTRNRI